MKTMVTNTMAAAKPATALPTPHLAFIAAFLLIKVFANGLCGP
jgi:hypothetical protein